LLNGATGDMSGVEGIWDFQANWQTLLTSEGAQEMTYFANFLNSIPWYNLAPDQDGTVFQGVGSPADYSGASTTDGTLGLAYKPSTGTGSQAFTVNLGTFSGAVTAQWYDPTAGTSLKVGTFNNSGTYTFDSPSTNSAGQNDFVLVLTASGAPVPRPPAGLTATPDTAQVLLSRAASSRATHDDIDHSPTNDGGGNTPIRTGITSTAFSDPGPSNGTEYSYHVPAINSAGRSSKSRDVSGRIPIVETSSLPDDDSGNDNSRDLIVESESPGNR
jgi:cellulose 1,4-beta-cellobiosidase